MSLYTLIYHHIYQCHSKIIKNDAQMCSKTYNQRVVSLPDSWRIHLQNYQSSMDDNTTHIYSDASFHQHPTTQATAGIIIINKSDYYNKSFKLEKLAIDDSTRSEIAAMCCSIKVAEQIPNTLNHSITIFCDSESAISAFEHTKANTTPFYHVYCNDLIAQVYSSVNRYTFEYVKGHDDENPNGLNHASDLLTHFHSQSLFAPLELKISKIPKRLRKQKPRDDVFRLKYWKEAATERYELLMDLHQLHDVCKITSSVT
eukprot:NODE_361_length_8796_cov_0.460274.p3 type:complete len:258 gc:universal NODE_361_length_8796_cov_0.460274:3418-2645(-)